MEPFFDFFYIFIVVKKYSFRWIESGRSGAQLGDLGADLGARLGHLVAKLSI